MMQSTLDRMATLGRFSLDLLAALGRAGVFFWQLVRAMGPAMRRPYLVVAQIHAVGNRSLSIILASGLAACSAGAPGAVRPRCCLPGTA